MERVGQKGLYQDSALLDIWYNIIKGLMRIL